MATDITRPGIAERDPYAEYADEVSTRPFDGDLLRFSKHGEYKAGQEQETVDEGTKMLVYMPGMKRGWVKWQEGQPVAHVMGLVSEGFKPPPREDLGDLDEDQWEELNGKPIDPWQKTNHLPMCNVDGQVFTFITSSKGGLAEIGRISDLFSNRRRMKPDEIPVITLQSRSYDHKLYGETFAPVFKVIGWTAIPQTFMELTTAIDDSSNESLVLEDLMDRESEDEEEIDTTPPPKRTASSKQAAPQKPKTAAAKAPPPKQPARRDSGKRSPRL